MKRFNEQVILQRTGGWYIILAVVLSQLIGLLGAIPGLVSIRLNIQLSEDLVKLFSLLAPVLIIAGQMILLGISWLITRNARARLTEWDNGELRTNPDKELSAWKEISSLTTRYGIGSFLVNFILVILPPYLITLSRREVISSVFQPGSIASPAPTYLLLGGLASTLGVSIFTLLILERLTKTARLVLLPKDFESQIIGRAGALLVTKFQVLIIGLIIIGIAIIAPVGYQQAVRILYSEVSSLQVFSDLRTQTLYLSGFALVLGIGFSYFATRSVSDPINNLIQILPKIEQGDLKQRVPVIATDELATVAMHFNRMIGRLDELQSTLEKQVAARTKQLTATNEVGRVASSILDPEELLSKTANLITEQFNYYYAAIYLLDPSEKWAELREATGQAGKVLKQNRHRLEVTGKSMVGRCIRERIPRIAQNTAEEKQRFENPLLPYTRSEIALPLILGDRVLGALNVQSTRPADFGDDVIETMQNMASQVAVAMENARLFQETRQSINELRAIQKQYLFEGWSSIKSYNEELEYGVGESSDFATQIMESPINLRDQTLGKITLESSAEWTPDQQILVDAVTVQAAIALENARLISESRLTAQRERTLTEINSKIWASPSIEAILQTVIKELGRRLDASNVTIELNLDEN